MVETGPRFCHVANTAMGEALQTDLGLIACACTVPTCDKAHHTLPCDSYLQQTATGRGHFSSIKSPLSLLFKKTITTFYFETESELPLAILKLEMCLSQLPESLGLQALCPSDLIILCFHDLAGLFAELTLIRLMVSFGKCWTVGGSAPYSVHLLPWIAQPPVLLHQDHVAHSDQ